MMAEFADKNPLKTTFCGTVNSSLLQQKRTETLVDIINNLQRKEDLDVQGQRILDLLEKDGQGTFEMHPNIFLTMVEKVHLCIKSKFCTKIIEKMAEKHKKDSQIGLLDKLLEKYPEDNYEDVRDLIVLKGLGDYPEHIFTSEYQEEVLAVIRILLTVDNSLSSRTKCLRILTSSTEVLSIYRCHFEWTTELRDTVMLLLHQGADPTWTSETSSIPTSFLFVKILMHNGEKFLYYPFIDLMKLLPLFLTEESLKCRAPCGTVLHVLVKCKWDSLSQRDDRFWDEYKRTITDILKAVPSVVNVTDKDGQTVLHVFMQTIFEYPLLGELLIYPLLGERLLSILPCLTTNENVNITDLDLVTPYTWILLGKAIYSVNPNKERGKVFSDIEEIFLRSGANPEIARAGSIVPILTWINRKLLCMDCNAEDLRALSKCMKNCNWKTHNYSNKGLLNDFAVAQMVCNLDNPELIQPFKDIITILVTNRSIAEHIWKGILKSASVTVTMFEILCLCIESGIIPSDDDVRCILSNIDAVKGSEDLTIVFLKTLVSMQKMKDFTCSLDFLAHYYVVSDEVLQLARQLVHGNSHNDHSGPMKLINHFLSTSSECENFVQLDHSLYEMLLPKNWLQRSPLHLAVIFLSNKKSLESLPNLIVARNINAQDMQGCTPLHVAYLHRNESAVNFLLSHGAKADLKDNFGKLPYSLGSYLGGGSQNGKQSTDHHEETIRNESFDCEEGHYQLCCRVLETKSGLLKKIKPMLVLQEKEAQALCAELKTLFERLVQDTKFSAAQIAIAGSMRERLKVGRLDEADIQIRLLSNSNCGVTGMELDDKLNHHCVMVLSETLVMRLKMINWAGIHLRPTSITGPWKFIREGCGLYTGMTVSVDIAIIVPVMETNARHDLRKPSYQKQQDILEDAPLRSMKKGLLLTTSIYDKSPFVATCEYEWDILDSLPTSYRLAFALSKAIVQAYDWSRGDRLRVKMPLTSYMIKTALFYLLSGHDYGNLEVRKGMLKLALSNMLKEEHDVSDYEYVNFVAGKTISQLVRPNMFNEEHDVAWNDIDMGRENLGGGGGGGGEGGGGQKLKFNPNPRWITSEDVNENAEEARLIASQIFKLIWFLTDSNFKLDVYSINLITQQEGIVLAEIGYIKHVCDSVLKCLKKEHFY